MEPSEPLRGLPSQPSKPPAREGSNTLDPRPPSGAAAATAAPLPPAHVPRPTPLPPPQLRTDPRLAPATCSRPVPPGGRRGSACPTDVRSHARTEAAAPPASASPTALAAGQLDTAVAPQCRAASSPASGRPAFAAAAAPRPSAQVSTPGARRSGSLARLHSSQQPGTRCPPATCALRRAAAAVGRRMSAPRRVASACSAHRFPLLSPSLLIQFGGGRARGRERIRQSASLRVPAWQVLLLSPLLTRGWVGPASHMHGPRARPPRPGVARACCHGATYGKVAVRKHAALMLDLYHFRHTPA